ncbi:hypothetical protein APHAL10511_000436 [Amanita phalloides]|nr:hypothetical protein APHAL10511_000436 [Amanita phalloides]
MPRKDASTGQISAQAQQDLVSEGIENFELPKSIVTKIAKSALPDNAKLQKESVLSLVKGSTVFINYLAATAHDVAQSKQHKSISASDVLKALELLEFGDLVEPLQNELLAYRELAKTDKSKKGSANLNNGQVAGSSASAPPNAAKKPGVAPNVGAAAAAQVQQQQQQQQSVTAPAKAPLKARVKGAKAAVLAGAASAVPVAGDDGDVQMGGGGGGGGEMGPEEDSGQVDQDDGTEMVGEGGMEESEGEEMVDTMEVEEEELRQDALGVEERRPTA